MSVVNTDPDSLLMQVPVPEQQHRVMIEAVENHMPEVIVIDEIGSEAEALASSHHRPEGCSARGHSSWGAARKHFEQPYIAEPVRWC